jgi:TolC family type I secretion outer membrane protein
MPKQARSLLTLAAALATTAPATAQTVSQPAAGQTGAGQVGMPQVGTLQSAGRPAWLDGDSGIPEVTPRSTAAGTAIVSAVDAPIDPRQPLPVFTPQFPYPTVPVSTAETGVRPVQTLAEAITLAYERNPTLLARRARLRSTDYLYPQARAGYGTTVNARGTYSFARDQVEARTGGFIGNQGFSSAASLIVNQPLFTFGRVTAAESSALGQIEFERDTLRLVEAEVMLDVVAGYVSVLRDAAAVTIAEQNLALLEQQFSDSAARFRVREITIADLDQVQTRLETARAQVIVARGQLGASQAQFLRDVGAPPGELAPPDVLSLPVSDLNDAYAIADAESPSIRAAQSREKVSRATISSAKAEFLPRVDVQGSFDYGTQTPYSDDVRATQTLGSVVLTVPLANGGLRQAQLGGAREANDSDRQLIDAAMRETRSAVASAWNSLASSRASVAYYLAATEAARNAFEGARLQERAGDRTTLDVLDLARDLLTVQINYNTAIANEYLSRASLLAAMGRLEAPQLLAGLTPYDPQAHYRRVSNRSDFPLVTDLLSGLDSLLLPRVSGDRPFLDPAVTTSTQATVELPPETSAVRVDPTQ